MKNIFNIYLWNIFGKINVLQYWLFFAFTVGVLLILSILSTYINFISINVIIHSIDTIFSIPSFIVITKRLNDIGVYRYISLIVGILMILPSKNFDTQIIIGWFLIGIIPSDFLIMLKEKILILYYKRN